MKWTVLTKLNWMLWMILLGSTMLSAVTIPAGSIKKGSETRHPNGQVRSFCLTAPQRIQGYLCLGWVEFNPAGRITGLDSAEEIVIGKDTLPARSRMYFYDTGELKTVLLAKPTNIQGLLCTGYGVESPMISFWDNGKLKTAYLKTPAKINGITAKSGSFSPVRFYADGNLESLTLRYRQILDRKSYPAGTIVSFDHIGRTRKAIRYSWFRRMGADLLDLFV